MEETKIYKMPLIGDPAPSFKAVTTQGEINFPEDYSGKWVILFSHPADFTPVCTTEFMKFATMADEFKAINTELVGLSVDSLYAHIAWLRKIQEIEWNGMKNVEVKFPLIEDIRMDVANKYGMIQPEMPTSDGIRTILANHMPIVAPIEIGQVVLIRENERETVVVSEGIFNFKDNKAHLFVRTFEYADEIDEARAQRAKERAEARLQQKLSRQEYLETEAALKRAITRLSTKR